jgi:GNAT superfamily N-acetyltransferase
MSLEFQQVGPETLPLYASVSIAYEVGSVYRVESIAGGLGGLMLKEQPVSPYVKDYDTQTEGDDNPQGWARQFDLSNWGFFLAMDGERAVGGAAVVLNSPEIHMLENRSDLAVLWDIRVQPEQRGKGIGWQLFQRAADWARGQNCTQLKIETQNVNVPACRFYARQGCHLGAILRHAYAGCPDVAHETMLLWYLDL